MRWFNIKNRKTLYFILSIIVVSIFSLTIVYAALSTVLNITGSTQITASNWDIHLENAVVRSGSVSANNPSISGNNLSFSVNLTKPGDFYEFTVDVVNDGSIDAMIDSVVKTPELTTAQAKYLKYEVSYQNGESISTKQTIKSGTSTPIKVRIEYRKDLSANDLPSTTTNLNLKLTLVYVQSDGSGSTIKDNGIASSVVKVKSGDGTQVGNEVCISNECFYVISSDDTSVTMLAKYNLHVGNTYDGSNLVEIENPTGIQNENAIGYISDEEFNEFYPFIGVTEFSDYGVDYNNSIVKQYINNYSDYLETQGVITINARLISNDEILSLGCNLSDWFCDENVPSWLYSTSYWTGALYSDDSYFVIYANGGFDPANYIFRLWFGVRPVITISRELVDNADGGEKKLINFNVNGWSYQAYEGMTWLELFDSEFNVENRFGNTDLYGENNWVWYGWQYDQIGWMENLYYDSELESIVLVDDVIIAGGTYYGG